MRPMIIRAQAHQGRSEPNPSNSLMGANTVGVEVNPGKQRMMIGAEDPSSPILRVLVQAVNSGLPNEPGTVPGSFGRPEFTAWTDRKRIGELGSSAPIIIRCLDRK